LIPGGNPPFQGVNSASVNDGVLKPLVYGDEPRTAVKEVIRLLFADDLVVPMIEGVTLFVVKGHTRLFDDTVHFLVCETGIVRAVLSLAAVEELVGIGYGRRQPRQHARVEIAL